MFTLGDKLRVLNADAEVSVSDAAGAPVVTSAAVALTDTITVDGFGKFPIANIADIKMHRAVTPINESNDFTITVPAGLAIGDAIEVRVYAKTTRYQSELKNNFIGAVRPITFMTLPLTAVTDTDIRNAIVAAWINRGFAFNNEAAVINIVNGAAATDVQISTAPTYESVNITKVEISRANSGIGTQTPVRLGVSVANAVGNEGLGTGKWLEESVKMATGLNTNPYGSDQATTNVDIRGEYTEVTFAITAIYDENLSTLAADHGPLNAVHRFTLWLNEATCLATNGSVDMFAASAVLAAGALANVDVNVIPAPLTPAQERVEALILEDGSSVATGAAFIA